MKYAIPLTVLCLFMTGCASQKQNDPIQETETPEETVYEYDGNPLMFRPQDENAVYLLEDGLSLQFKGSMQNADCCEETSCLVYDTVLLRGKSETELELFENRSLPLNSDTGYMILQKMEPLYFLSFNDEQQYDNSCACVFDAEGNILQEFDHVAITMNTVYVNQFLVTYPRGKSGNDCGASQMCPYEEVWSVTEEGLEYGPLMSGMSAQDTEKWTNALLEVYPDLRVYAADPDNLTETIELDGHLCRIAYFGTVQPNGWFTRERTFAVAEDCSVIYEYNTAEDTWYYEEH